MSGPVLSGSAGEEGNVVWSELRCKDRFANIIGEVILQDLTVRNQALKSLSVHPRVNFGSLMSVTVAELVSSFVEVVDGLIHVIIPGTLAANVRPIFQHVRGSAFINSGLSRVVQCDTWHWKIGSASSCRTGGGDHVFPPL